MKSVITWLAILISTEFFSGLFGAIITWRKPHTRKLSVILSAIALQGLVLMIYVTRTMLKLGPTWHHWLTWVWIIVSLLLTLSVWHFVLYVTGMIPPIWSRNASAQDT